MFDETERRIRRIIALLMCIFLFLLCLRLVTVTYKLFLSPV